MIPRSAALIVTATLMTACAGPMIEQGYMQPYKHQRGIHIGLDLSGYEGEPVYAVMDGVVTGAGPNLVKIQHTDTRETVYYHIGHVRVSIGQQVRKGQQVAQLALDGVRGPHDHRTITRAHLHLELHSALGRGQDPETLNMKCDGDGAWWPVGCRR
jgi:murein DD-endopeptidase MepM/ murein hydrolase activator NlpD